jgi:hypothetical protein
MIKNSPKRALGLAKNLLYRPYCQCLNVGGAGRGVGASLVQQQTCPQLGQMQANRQDGIPRGGVCVCKCSSYRCSLQEEQ